MLRTLIGHSAIYTAANLAARGTVLVTLIALSFFLSPTEYGALGMIATLAALVNVTVPLEITQALARYHGTASPGERQLYSASAWWFSVIMLAAAAAIALLWQQPLCLLVLGDLRFLEALRLAILFFVANSLFYFLQCQFRWEFRLGGYALVTLVWALSTMALSVALAATLPFPLEGVMIGQLAGAGVAVLIGGVLVRRSIVRRMDSEKLRTMLAFSLPLVPASLAILAGTYASRLILNGLADLDEVGIFTFASQIAAIAALTVLGVQSALTPLVMAHHAKAETPAAIARLFEGFSALALLVCLALGLLVPEAILHFGNPAFGSAAPLVLLLAPGYLFLQMYVFAPGFAVAKRTGQQMLVSIVSGLTCVALNFVLIGQLGILGAAIATLLAGTAFLAMWLILSQRLYPLPVRWKPLAASLAVWVAAAATGSSFDPASPLVSVPVKLAALAAVTGAFVALRLLPLRRLARLMAQSITESPAA
ncbi:MAG: lipopolysaccharide biosynthesis protein [Sphingosinicella sp.]